MVSLCGIKKISHDHEKIFVQLEEVIVLSLQILQETSEALKKIIKKNIKAIIGMSVQENICEAVCKRTRLKIQ